jgi:hypothetical protein
MHVRPAPIGHSVFLITSANTAGMKPRHAAALALVGWYLMLQPLDSRGCPDHLVPISGWEIEEVYDTAAQCKQARDDDMETVRQHVNDPEIRKLPCTPLDKLSGPARECVAFDDPRLKEK